MELLWGKYAQVFSSKKSMFNGATVDIVQQAIESDRRCNSDMLSLLGGVTSGLAIGAHQKWLREALGDLAGKLSGSTIKLKGLACMVTTFSAYRNQIELTFW